MRGPGISRLWRNRLLVGTLLGAVGYPAAVLLRFGPQPVPYAVMVAIVLTLAWLVLDTLDAPPARWLPALPSVDDRVGEATADLRILSSHVQATSPSSAVRDRLVSLARSREPALADDLLHELSPERRLSPADIDRILTRIEDVHDRS